MYAEGDGVERNDYKAFELFSDVANAHADESPANNPRRSSRTPSFASAPTIARAYRTAR